MDISSFCLAQEAMETYRFFEKIKEISFTREVVFLCVGSSKVWYDSFGPMFGSLLKYLDIDKFIYGNLSANITAKNLGEYVDMIYRFHVSPYVVVIDNCLASEDGRGVYIKEGPLTCAAYSSSPLSVGDAHICYGLSKKEIEDNHNYIKMLKSIKSVVRMLMFVLENDKNKNSNVNN